MEYIKLQNKIKNKWIGMKAVTKSDEYFGRTGVIENVKLRPVIDRADEYTLHYVINCGHYKIISPEDKTVIMLDSQFSK